MEKKSGGPRGEGRVKSEEGGGLAERGTSEEKNNTNEKFGYFEGSIGDLIKKARESAVGFLKKNYSTG
jgi:hypothetical protein